MKEPRNFLATSEIEKEFADLRELFEKIFCIPATSEPVERVISTSEFLADRTNSRAYATVLRLSVVCLSVCDVMYRG